MKKYGALFFLVFLLGTVNFSYSQQISISKDSLYFPEEFSHDTLFVYNTGTETLLIDSLFSIHEEFAYRLEAQAKDTTIFYMIDGGHAPFHLTIEATDSALFIFESPDLCSICKAPADQSYFEDSLIIMNNSLTDDSLLLFSYGQGYPSALPEAGSKQPADFILLQNYPNPFNPITAIGYQLSAVSFVRLAVYNLLGQKVATLVSKEQTAGKHTVAWNATGFASGVYYYRLETDKGFVRTRKLVLLK